MYDAPHRLAAIQVAVPARVVTMDLSKKEGPQEPYVFINPEILWKSEERSVYEEGCLSIPEFYADVMRPARCACVISPRWQWNEIEAEGLLATCPAARDRPPQRRAVHRPYFAAQAHARGQEVREGGETRG